MPTTLDSTIPVEFTQQTEQPSPVPSIEEDRIRSYVISWRNQLHKNRLAKQNIWNECWQLYRGAEDWSDKEDWQSKIVLPKAWSSVKQATSVIKRFISAAKKPWNIEPTNPNDLITQQRAEQMTKLTRVFLEQAHYIEEFAEGLECGFIMGLGVWKLWWGLEPRVRTRVQTRLVPSVTNVSGFEPASAPQGNAFTDLLAGEPSGRETGIAGQLGQEYPQQNNQLYPTQLPGEALDPNGWQGPGGPSPFFPPQLPQYSTERQVIREETLEGRLMVQAVDPYHFYWLPGSKLNRWIGTIEDIEVPKWQLIELAEKGYLDPEKVAQVQPKKLDEAKRQAGLRFTEPVQPNNGPSADTGVVTITEFYGPIVLDGKVIEKNAHVLIANDSVLLLRNGYQKNAFWHGKPPYIGFSPLSLPFRTEGVGLVEMVRAIDKALSRLANLSIDTLLFRLMPLFEVNLDAYENPEDFQTGMTPGKIFRRNSAYAGQPGIVPIQFEDISQGSVQVSAQLDRAHQEGALVSEIQQSLPRYRGVQTATEIQEKSQNQESFFGAMATDIEKQALEPMVDMACDLIMQFIDTSADPRVAEVLGVGVDYLRGIPREELIEMILGEYRIKVTGITSQLEKAEMLQNLVQFMNLIGQNPEAWLPYINQDKLLQRILESFRPAIHDIEDIIATPEMVLSNKAAMSNQQVTPELLRMLPQLVQLQQAAAQQEQQAEMQQQQQAVDLAMQQQEMTMRQQEMQNQQRMAKQQQKQQPQQPRAAA